MVNSIWKEYFFLKVYIYWGGGPSWIAAPGPMYPPLPAGVITKLLAEGDFDAGTHVINITKVLFLWFSPSTGPLDLSNTQIK